MNYFYTHLLNNKQIEDALIDILEEEKHREELLSMYHSALHHRVLDHLLSNIPEKHHAHFISLIDDENHDETWVLLRDNLEDPEGAIQLIVSEISKDWYSDVLLLKIEKFSE